MKIQQLYGVGLSPSWQKFITESNAKAFAWTKQMTQVCFDHPHILFIIVAKNNQPLAYIMGYDFQISYDIIQIYVRELDRGQGIAKQLIRHTQALEGMEEMLLEVRESNVPAIQLYKSTGFETVGKRQDYYQNPQEDALVMRWERKESHEDI